MSEESSSRGQRFCFFAERQVGIGSAAAAIEPYVRRVPGVTWVDVTYVKPDGLLERSPLPKRASGTLRGVLQTRAGLRQGPFDALFFLTHNPAVLQPRALTGTATVLWTDVTPALLDAQAEQYAHSVDGSPLLARVKHALVQRTFRSARFAVGWSEWARRSFVADYSVAEERTRVIPPGVDLSHFRRADRQPGSGRPRLLFVGGDFARKGGPLLLEVFRSELRGKCELDIVTRDAVTEEPGVRVHHGLDAKSERLATLYREATALVLPTRGDCFSIASLEAMAMGLPVVITAVGGISDIVEHGGSGYLVPVGEARPLAEALQGLLADLPRALAMGARGRELVETRFDAEQSARRLLELMAEAGRDAPPPSGRNNA